MYKIGVLGLSLIHIYLADWVLSRFSETQQKNLAAALENAAAAAELIAQGDIDRAMNLYNS